ncbi:hypothetical protein D6764_02760 [Candidatus Woesearchaeota archaeon]|nr:MAG: hypothetical protein D6764_02760 [Candidatus Woesearchaeota archaeon]
MTQQERKQNIISVIADEDTVLGFRLAGVQNSIAVDVESQNAAEQIEAAAAKIISLYGEDGSGLLILTEGVYDFMDRNNILKKFRPLHGITLVQVPDKSGSKGVAKQKLAKLFEEAIGVAMKK